MLTFHGSCLFWIFMGHMPNVTILRTVRNLKCQHFLIINRLSYDCAKNMELLCRDCTIQWWWYNHKIGICCTCTRWGFMTVSCPSHNPCLGKVMWNPLYIINKGTYYFVIFDGIHHVTNATSWTLCTANKTKDFLVFWVMCDEGYLVYWVLKQDILQ